MFDSTPMSSDRNSPDLNVNQLRDGLASLTHRVGQLQALLSRKMDRSQCLSIVEKKASHGQLKRCMDEVESRLKEEQSQELQRAAKMQEIAIGKINQLGKKLKTSAISKPNKSEPKSVLKEKANRVIKPQQLFIESNETMFALLIEEVSKLQQRDDEIQKQLDLRNKKIINLNNEVCTKLERLQAEIDQKIKYNHNLSESKAGNTWSHLDRTNKVTVHKCNNENSNFQALRMDMLTKNIETLQQELLGKMNIKDVLPLIKQNCQPLAQSLEEVRDYVEQSMESTKKILSSQTEINKEISQGVKLTWWHSYQQQHQFALINKQIINLVPEIIQVGPGNNPNFVKVHQQGLYLLKIHSIENNPSLEGDEEEDDMFEVMIGTEVMVMGRENVLRLEKGNELRIIQRVNREIVVCLQKL